uniref:Immunoglobulin V-set domain-containing protein n=1 Tax=Chelonoidis abingdonii TaxID=106734 RepID=A0A8C0GY02_CHEAB
HNPLSPWLLSVLRSDWDWGVTLPTGPLAGWSGSCMTIPCSYTYPEGQLVKAVTWSRDKERIVRLTATTRQGYDKAKRAQFLGDLQHNCTLQLNPLALGDGGAYSFEFQTQSQSWRSPRVVCLTVSGNPWLLLQKQPSLAPCGVMCSCSSAALPQRWLHLSAHRAIPKDGCCTPLTTFHSNQMTTFCKAVKK